MPLSQPAPREPLHVRRIECRGFRREDGLWDIEGHLVDTKTYAFSNQDRGEIKPGMALHEMWIRVTLDDRMTVKAVEAVTDAGPFHICGDVVPAFKKLEGLTIGPGWKKHVKERLGGTQGCTHIVELLGPVATTAFQTMFSRRERERRAEKDEGKRKTRPRIIDSCHALSADGPVVKREWPEFYTGR
ncbi:MAG: DUF2889 domain-containing protein [Alphaproteobacteria bacterium]|nr:DUF2889 domain-containing protein [Alphaproteobacteria bacterium]